MPALVSASTPPTFSPPRNEAFLRTSPIEPGDVWRRVSNGPKFWRSTIMQAITAYVAHVLVGWLTYTCWGTCPIPAPGERDACFTLPGKEHEDSGGVTLINEVFIDATVTACVISSVQWLTRFRDVRLGIIPVVQQQAFPRGCVLTFLYPNWCDCLGGDRPTRQDWAAHLRTLIALALCWGLVFGGFTLVVLLLISMIPIGGGSGRTLCFSPWAYILARAAWTDIEVVLVAMGSFCLWSSRAAPSELELSPPSNMFSVVSGLGPRGKLREPLSPISPADFVSVN
mmetsp:Transcript_31283/g.81734  ORF Transcript_31283/g.81734 Transcript_31283/m.81734 type:complete len:284 (-) Transcript_31283:124-975(-)